MVDSVGFIGLGKMGMPMARNLLPHYKLIVWNRSAGKARLLEREGAEVASSPMEVASRAEVIITMLARPEVTEAVVLGLGEYSSRGVIDGISEGKILVNMATDPPSLARRIAGETKRRGAGFVAAPVLGSVIHAENARLTILVDGEPSVVEKVKPVLEKLGQKIIYVGETGSANTMKILMNINLLITTTAFAEVLLLGERMGLSPEKIVDIFNQSIFRSYVTEYKGPQMARRDWKPMFTLELAAKDLSLGLEEARKAKTPMPLAAAVRELLEVALAKGWKDLDYAAIFKVYNSLV